MAFQFGINKPISSPQEAERTRLLAQALMSQGMPQNWGQGLAALTGAFTGTQLNNRASDAERAGQQSAAEALSRISGGGTQADIVSALSNPWITPAQSSVASALLGQQLERSDPMYQLQIAQAEADLANSLGGGSTEYFGTPVPFENPDGTISFGQLGKDGSFKPIDLPEGAAPAPNTRQVDTGTEIITQDIYGNELFRTPKDIRGAEREQAIGTAEGAAIVAAPGDIASGEMALDLLDQIENHPELPWATGQSVIYGGNTGLIPGTMGRRDFQNLVDQATSGAFLTAIQEMRGLGSLSNAEGQTATAAVTRMNTATTAEAFKKALQDYREVITKGMNRARSKIGQPPVEAPEASDNVDDILTQYGL